VSLDKGSKLSITMPCFNEEEGIFQFISELQRSFHGINVQFIIVDDLSTDHTADQLREICDEFTNVVILRNSKNVGHGPSTLKGLSYALNDDSDLVLAVDGDGQFDGADLRRSFDQFSRIHSDILEGARTDRNDPVFRKVITFSLRVFVLGKTRSFPADANTPFRIYRRGALERLLPLIDSNSLIPNVEISILSRKLGLSISVIRVHSRDRIGANKIGTTWKSTSDWLPSKRFVAFCAKASRQLFSTFFKFR
jgi:dolichol-phosphate mannosyltransferase